MTHIEDLVDAWGLCSLFSTEKPDVNVHPDDFERFAHLHPYGKVFHCVGLEMEYLILEYQYQRYRVKPVKFHVVIYPAFDFGDKVIDPNHPEQIGVIRDIGWHFNKQVAFYFITLNGKKKL